MALFVSMFAFFAVAGGTRNVEAGCGDHLRHSHVGMFSDSTIPVTPNTACEGGNCRSAPMLPPFEPLRIVVSLKQSLNFQPADLDANASKSRIFELHDDALPSSSPLEVLTPPPIAAA